MSIEVKQLKEAGVAFYPVVAAEAVIFENGDNLEEAIGNVSVDTSDCEKVANKVTAISSSSTNIQYPTAKAVYDYIGNMESVLDAIIAGTYQTT